MASIIKSAFLVLISLLVLFTYNVDARNSTGYTSISIGGMVFCKSCKFWGYVNYMDASPIPGAVVRVTCYYSARKPVTVVATTGSTGFFRTSWPSVVNFSVRKCRAYLSYSPLTFCNVPIYPNASTSAPMKLQLVNVTRGVGAFYTPGVLFYGPKSRNNTICSERS